MDIEYELHIENLDMEKEDYQRSKKEDFQENMVFLASFLTCILAALYAALA